MSRARRVLVPFGGGSRFVTIPQYLAGWGGVMFTFDDASDDIYDTVYPILQARRGRGTFYVITSQVGDADATYVRWDELQALDAAGWSIGHHTQNHAHLTALSEEDATIEIAAAKADLDGQGLTKASMHMSYPFGEQNATVIAAATAAGMVSSRTTAGGYITLPATNLMLIPCNSSPDSTTTLATLTGLVDTAWAGKKVLVILIHATGGAGISAATLTALVDYIASNRIPFLTIDDVYRAMSGPVTVPVGP